MKPSKLQGLKCRQNDDASFKQLDKSYIQQGNIFAWKFSGEFQKFIKKVADNINAKSSSSLNQGWQTQNTAAYFS